MSATVLYNQRLHSFHEENKESINGGKKREKSICKEKKKERDGKEIKKKGFKLT